MAYTGEHHIQSFTTSSDMRTKQWSIVEMASSAVGICDFAAAKTGFGVVVNNPNTGEMASVVTEGETRVRCGSGGLAVRDLVISAASGWATKLNDAETGPLAIMGICKTAAASGSLATLDVQRQFVINSGNNLV